MLLAEFGTGQVFWSMLWFFLFFIWIWLLIVVFSDIFRSHDLSGWAKALWMIFIILLPYLGVFVYLIARGHKMQEHAIAGRPGSRTRRCASTSRASPPPAAAAPPTRSHARRPARQGRDLRGRVPEGQGEGVVLRGKPASTLSRCAEPASGLRLGRSQPHPSLTTSIACRKRRPRSKCKAVSDERWRAARSLTARQDSTRVVSNRRPLSAHRSL